jgi:hypothetical protein
MNSIEAFRGKLLTVIYPHDSLSVNKEIRNEKPPHHGG